MEAVITGDVLTSDFTRAIVEESGQNVNLCYQCKKCTAGCPIAYEMDLTPTQIIQAVRFGQKDIVLGSKTIWLCASCETCTTRCPQDVDIAKVMDAARIIARREGAKPAEEDIQKFFHWTLRNIKWFGRLYEIGLIAGLKLATGNFKKDIGLGMRMFFKGKLRVFPRLSDFIGVKRMFRKVKAYEERKKMGR